MNLLLNTHYYDGKLPVICTSLINQIDVNQYIPTLNEISSSLNNGIPNLPAIQKTLQLFQNDRPNNYDSKNKINAEHLLILVWNKVKTFDLKAKLVFFEQLADISLYGPCSQGRTTRLIQFL